MAPRQIKDILEKYKSESLGMGGGSTGDSDAVSGNQNINKSERSLIEVSINIE